MATFRSLRPSLSSPSSSLRGSSLWIFLSVSLSQVTKSSNAPWKAWALKIVKKDIIDKILKLDEGLNLKDVYKRSTTPHMEETVQRLIARGSIMTEP